MGKLNPYFNLTKPVISVAFYFLFLFAFLIGLPNFHFDFDVLVRFLLGSLAVLLSISGSNILNNFFDRDIDSLMYRTRNRPLPTGVVSPGEALSLGLILLSSSFLLAFYLGLLPISLLVVGIFSYLFFYTLLGKRRTVVNVFLTMPAVATPVWFGFFMGRGSLNLNGFLIGLIVSFWGVSHLWSLAMVYGKDYVRAKIPMLTAVVSWGKAKWHVFISSFALSMYSFSLYFLGVFNGLYLIYVLVPNFILLSIALKLVFKPLGKYSWMIYKFSTFYIMEVLLSALMDVHLSFNFQNLVLGVSVNLMVSAFYIYILRKRKIILR